MFLNFLSKSKSNKTPKLEQAITCIKEQKFDEALLIALAEMKKEERIKYVANFITKSHWRINSAALELFNGAITKYEQVKDPKILEHYMTKLNTEMRSTGASSHSHMFFQIRAHVINDLLHDDPSKSAESLIQTHRMESYLGQREDQETTEFANFLHQKYIETVIDVVSKVWPEKSMLKVLYG